MHIFAESGIIRVDEISIKQIGIWYREECAGFFLGFHIVSQLQAQFIFISITADDFSF